jgi:hypothetical protein
VNPGHHAEWVISPGPDDAAGRAHAHDGVMARRTRAKRLRDVRVDVRAGAMLVAMLTPHLVRAFLESRSRRIAVYAVGGAAAGIAAARAIAHRPRTDSA